MRRAVGLAAMDRFDEAQAEIESLPASFLGLAIARFLVRLLTLVRQGDLGAALRFAEQEAHDLPLGPLPELVADAVRVAVAPRACGPAEVLRVKEELRGVQMRRWTQAFAPELLHAVERAPKHDTDRPAQDEADGAREEAALAEAAAGVRRTRA
jgi:hypothetical protein